MVTAYIGIGSNKGNTRHNCLEAVEKVKGIPGYKITGLAGWYLTRPVGVEGQDWYLNSAFSISLKVPSRSLLKSLLSIEADMGRVRKHRWESRIIDLDILLYGEKIIDEKGLKVPHPLMHLRKFVLAPMVDLAPELIHPSLGLTMRELLERLPEDDQDVIPLGRSRCDF